MPWELCIEALCIFLFGLKWEACASWPRPMCSINSLLFFVCSFVDAHSAEQAKFRKSVCKQACNGVFTGESIPQHPQQVHNNAKWTML
eukprot:1377066-Amphidinium_carterae.1